MRLCGLWWVLCAVFSAAPALARPPGEVIATELLRDATDDTRQAVSFGRDAVTRIQLEALVSQGIVRGETYQRLFARPDVAPILPKLLPAFLRLHGVPGFSGIVESLADAPSTEALDEAAYFLHHAARVDLEHGVAQLYRADGNRLAIGVLENDALIVSVPFPDGYQPRDAQINRIFKTLQSVTADETKFERGLGNKANRRIILLGERLRRSERERLQRQAKAMNLPEVHTRGRKDLLDLPYILPKTTPQPLLRQDAARRAGQMLSSLRGRKLESLESDVEVQEAITGLIQRDHIRRDAIYGLLRHDDLSPGALRQILVALAKLDHMPSIDHIVARILTGSHREVRGLKYQLDRAVELDALFGVADVGHKIQGIGQDIDVVLRDGTFVEVKALPEDGELSQRLVRESVQELAMVRDLVGGAALPGLSLAPGAQLGGRFLLVTHRDLSKTELSILKEQRRVAGLSNLRFWRIGMNASIATGTNRKLIRGRPSSSAGFRNPRTTTVRPKPGIRTRFPRRLAR
jgi:hypothetical protein